MTLPTKKFCVIQSDGRNHMLSLLIRPQGSQTWLVVGIIKNLNQYGCLEPTLIGSGICMTGEAATAEKHCVSPTSEIVLRTHTVFLVKSRTSSSFVLLKSCFYTSLVHIQTHQLSPDSSYHLILSPH